MSTEKLFSNLKNWFELYAQSFIADNITINQNIQLKISHTNRVIDEMASLCLSLNLSENEINIAKIIALFHDVARFEQFKKYGTFSDRKSINHGILGQKIIEEYNLLQEFSDMDKNYINNAIQYHNSAKIPSHLSEREMFFLQLIRDADKLDILKVVTDHYSNPDENFKESIILGLPDNNIVSPKVFEHIQEEKVVSHEDLESVTDFKLLQMAWVFDIGFKHTLQIIHDRKYIEKIYRTIPSNGKVDLIYDKVNSFLNTKLSL